MTYPKRKTIRLEGYDYDTPGYYFVTVCTVNRQKLLCEITEPIVGTVALDGPLVRLTKFGGIVAKHLDGFKDFYPDIKIESYVIMPNHIHLMIHVLHGEDGPSGATVPTGAEVKCGPSRATVPTVSKVGRLVGAIKRFCNREIGCNIWQDRFNDRVIRDERHYLKTMEYIETNPLRWIDDDLYVP